MKKIIVPVDFSEHSEYALKTAVKLAKRIDREFTDSRALENARLAELNQPADQLLRQARLHARVVMVASRDHLDRHRRAQFFVS